MTDPIDRSVKIIGSVPRRARSPMTTRSRSGRTAGVGELRRAPRLSTRVLSDSCVYLRPAAPRRISVAGSRRVGIDDVTASRRERARTVRLRQRRRLSGSCPAHPYSRGERCPVDQTVSLPTTVGGTIFAWVDGDVPEGSSGNPGSLVTNPATSCARGLIERSPTCARLLAATSRGRSGRTQLQRQSCNAVPTRIPECP